jgi:methylated-DNA-[protein]-cysteine S-methyltransferase
VRFGQPPEPVKPVKSAAGSPALDRPGALAARACEQLAEYFAGQRRSFDVPVDWAAALGKRAPGVRRRVLTVLKDGVGFGETVTYGVLAGRAGLFGDSGAGEGDAGGGDGPMPPARVVGQIMASNPCPLLVPCHRVLAGNGLGGFSGGAGIEVKRWLLTFEGALPPALW